MVEVTKATLIDLAKTHNVEGINSKTTKVALIAALNDAGVEIEGMEPATKIDEPSGPVERTAQGKFPGRKLEAKRAENGSIKLTQARVEVEGKKVFEYTIEHELADGTRNNLQTMRGSYETAKFASRDVAVTIQCAFDVKQDYTRA